MSDFLPDYRAVPTSRGWRPSVLRFVGEREKLVPYPGGPRYFETREEAIAAAKEYMRETLNRKIEGDRSCDHEAELSEIEAWKKRKIAEAEAERLRVFGGGSCRIVRDHAGNEVKVEIVSRQKRMVRA